MRLGLGTVQFGLDYGVSNAAGRTPEDEVAHILGLAASSGIEVIDTAAAYGESEAVLGRALCGANARFKIVTKLASGVAGPDEAEASLRTSLDRLGVPSVAGLLVHRPADLLGPDGSALWERMASLRDAGLVGRIGASVYSGSETDVLMEHFPLELVQAPANAFDQRLLASGHLARLRSAGVEVHLRSAFLQGLLLMEPEGVPERFEQWRAKLRAYHEWVRERGWTPLRAALGFALGLPGDVVIVGVNSAAQLEGIVAVAAPLPLEEFAQWASDEAGFVDPSAWGV